jgi:hypothetical protein
MENTKLRFDAKLLQDFGIAVTIRARRGKKGSNRNERAAI